MSDDEFLENSTFTHDELLKITSTVLNELLSKDSYLNDLPADVTVDEVNNQLAVLYGQSITVYVARGHHFISVVVPQSGCRVFALKQAIKRAINLKLEREEGSKRKVSWKHVWRCYELESEGVALADNNLLLSKAGVRHKSKIYFVKKRRKKNVG